MCPTTLAVASLLCALPHSAAFAPSARAPPLPRTRKRAPSPCAIAAEDPTIGETLSRFPARTAMAAGWVGFSVYVAAFSPGGWLAESDTALINNAIADPTSLNPIFFAVFNALGARSAGARQRTRATHAGRARRCRPRHQRGTPPSRRTGPAAARRALRRRLLRPRLRRDRALPRTPKAEARAGRAKLARLRHSV